jgi:hypothetical protein
MATRRASVTRQAIEAVSAGAVASLLVPHGFKRRAPHFWRETDGIYQSVNFQGSQWGTSDDGQFTINLGVSSPVLYTSFTGREFPKNPSTVLWPIYNRIGGLMPSRCDLWWKVDAHTDVIALGLEVATAVRDYALPFFERIRTAEQFNVLLLGDQPIPGVTAAQRPLVGATLAVRLGQKVEAQRLLSAALDVHRGKPFESTVRAVAKQLEVRLDGA